MRRVGLLLLLVLLSHTARSAEPTAVTSASTLEAFMVYRQWLLAYCPKIDPSNTNSYQQVGQAFADTTRDLEAKILQIMLHQTMQMNPGVDAATAAAHLDSKLKDARDSTFTMNTRLSESDPKGSLQKCDYVIHPEARKKYGATRQWNNMLVASPDEAYPDEVRVVKNALP